jgi:2-polyprenyl-3-methyl-5-hydroxy-6-metoxy-1,4-benzoquinol methylase
VEGAAAELYQRHLVPAVTAGWAVGRVGLRYGERVLDVACGTGVVARVAAERVGWTGRVTGIDMNAAMLGVARSLQGGTGVSIGSAAGGEISAGSNPCGTETAGAVRSGRSRR